MHQSLKPSANLLLIAIFLAGVITGVVIPAAPSRMVILGVGAFFGAVAGTLQLRAIEEKKEQFLAADSALAVRTAMKASWAGRSAVYILWAAAAVLLAIAFIQKEGMFLRVLAGYTAFALVRDTIALKGCFDLQRAYQKKG